MRVLFFVWDVSVGCEYTGGTRGSGIVSSAYDVLEMSVVCGVRGVWFGASGY